MWGGHLIYVAQPVLVKCSYFPLGLEPDIVPADDSALHTTDRAKEGFHYFHTTWATYRNLICFKDFFCCLQLVVHICKTLWMFSKTICNSLQWNVSLSISVPMVFSYYFRLKMSSWDLPKGNLLEELFCMKSFFESNVYLIILWSVHMHISLCLCFFVYFEFCVCLCCCMMVSDDKKELIHSSDFVCVLGLIYRDYLKDFV